MRVLILGSKGMLGQELVKTFSDQEVTAWNRQDIDVMQTSLLQTQLEALRPEIIFNAIAYNDVDGAQTSTGEEQAHLLNAVFPGILAKISSRLGAKLVHYSTDYIFDGTKREGYTEDNQPHPINVYGQTKYEGELNVQHNDPQAVIIRLSRLFGNAGTSEHTKRSFVDTMLHLAQTRNHLEIVDAEHSSPTYVVDLAERSKEIIASNSSGIYHVTNSGFCTWYTFAQEIFSQKGLDITLEAVGPERFPRPAKRPDFCVLHTTRLSTLRSWQEALRSYLSSL